MSVARDIAFAFDALTIEGALLPAEWLTKVAALQARFQSGLDYGIPKGLNLRDELGRYWRIAQAHWADFAAAREQNPDSPTAANCFVGGLLREVFGAADWQPAAAPRNINDYEYPVTAFACDGRLPVVIAPPDQSLDQRDRRFGDGGRQRSAFGLLQDYLNAEDEALWGLASNGVELRLGRDNNSLTRPAWIAADLERIFTEERFADFSLLWLLIHASRFGGAHIPVEQCALEAWRDASREEGTRARDELRLGVEAALKALGQGFLAEPANTSLRERLAGGDLSVDRYFRQLLRLVYRLIFLLTIEERGLLHPSDADAEAVELYEQGYGLRRLRERARRRRAFDRHRDLWLGLRPVWTGLASGEPLLALPALGGLFAPEQCPDLDTAELGNRALLTAMFHLSWLPADGSLARINWRDMGPEELGSIYESLLELVPDLSSEARRFGFADVEQARGNARKTSGSYYTPDPLVQELLDSALDPVIAARTAGAADPAQALLSITVCDPACGSGHFLLAAARRLATHLAHLRAAGTPSGDEYRHALRDVVTHCIYGVDVNPMALELARMSLWLEAMTPDKPLGFLDHHLQCGDALLGVLDLSILDQGLPDDAYKPLTGDDRKLAAGLKKLNKSERTSWQRALATGDLFRTAHLADAGDALDQIGDEDLAAVAAKRAAWREAEKAAHASRLARLADMYVAAFLLSKTQETQHQIPSSRHLWAVVNGETAAGQSEAETAARAACREARVFHWWLAFPQVHAAGGFAVMLGNPPWEQIKLKEQEYFAARNAAVANAQNKAERTRRIALLAEGRLQQTLDERDTHVARPNVVEQRIFASFEQVKRIAEATSAFVHASSKELPGRYQLTGRGDVDTYALFAETFFQLRSGMGRAGFIVKSGIATDDTYKRYFQAVTKSNQLKSFLGFDNAKRIFPAVHPDTPFALVTLGAPAGAANICHYILALHQLADLRRYFALTSEDFALLNPNTRTCPVFRSVHDAALTKAIYRRVPPLIREEVTNADGEIVAPEANPWGIDFQRMFDMSTDSSLFLDAPAVGLLPLYEAKMMHQFDHRWAAYVPQPKSKPKITDCTYTQKADPGFTVTPRYWVEQNEALARIARVPRGVASEWFAARKVADEAALADANAKLWLALAQWIAGECFRREAGEPPEGGYANAQKLAAARRVEARLAAEFTVCAAALREARITGRKAATEFAKWAARDAATSLDDNELAVLSDLTEKANTDQRDLTLLAELDSWMDRRSPRWLMGWRDITNATNERTVIASVIPRSGVGNNLPLMLVDATIDPRAACALLANLNSLVLDFVARQKVGGTHLNYFTYKQLPVLPPARYSNDDLDFIVPRVLRLTYTSYDLADWARDLGYTGAPFEWNHDRRVQLRAALDQRFAKLYGLSKDEMRYILDPAEVEDQDYPSETFRVLKNNDIKLYGRYRTRDMVLDAWDAFESGELTAAVSQPSVPEAMVTGNRREASLSEYKSAITPCCETEDWLAGLALDVLLRAGPLSEDSLRSILVSQLPPDTANAEILGVWVTSERIVRLPRIAGWFRKLFSLPAFGDLYIPDGADTSAVLGDERTKALAESLIRAYNAQQAAMQAINEADTAPSVDEKPSGTEGRG